MSTWPNRGGLRRPLRGAEIKKIKTQNQKPKTQAAQLGLEAEGWQGAGATYCRFTVWSLFTRGSGWLKKSLSSPRVWAL